MWAWKAFLRGQHPILMDFGLFGGANPPDPSAGTPSYASFEAVRYAMGDTRRFAERLNLLQMESRGDLSSTGYALASPGAEYLVLQPSETAQPITLNVEPGRYALEWFHVQQRETLAGDTLTVERAGSQRL